MAVRFRTRRPSRWPLPGVSPKAHVSHKPHPHHGRLSRKERRRICTLTYRDPQRPMPPAPAAVTRGADAAREHTAKTGNAHTATATTPHPKPGSLLDAPNPDLLTRPHSPKARPHRHVPETGHQPEHGHPGTPNERSGVVLTAGLFTVTGLIPAATEARSDRKMLFSRARTPRDGRRRRPR
jgi:hypothetical protein